VPPFLVDNSLGNACERPAGGGSQELAGGG